MISVHTKAIKELIDNKFATDIKKYTDKLNCDLNNLLSETTVVTEDWQKKYVRKIIEKRHELVTGLPSDLDKLKRVFDKIKNYKIVSEDKYKAFRKRLIVKMGYSDRRGDLYPEYFKEVGIKSCVYCNALLTVSVDAEEFDDKLILKDEFVRAKFQTDHFIAKKKYPCFSVSLFNLYPVCGPCNNVKSTRVVNFKLYNEKDKVANQSNYEFSLEPGCVAEYLSSLDQSKLKIIFNDPDKKDKKTFGVGSLVDTFDINGIYATQLDVVEELILKRKVYNESYKSTLIKAFPKLFNRSDLSDRVLLGNYTSPDDMHKRPLAKFMQDIDLAIKAVLPPDVADHP